MIICVFVTNRLLMRIKYHIYVHLQSQKSLQEKKLCLTMEILTAHGDMYVN